jgi:hypothetical protein
VGHPHKSGLESLARATRSLIGIFPLDGRPPRVLDHLSAILRRPAGWPRRQGVLAWPNRKTLFALCWTATGPTVVLEQLSTNGRRRRRFTILLPSPCI